MTASAILVFACAGIAAMCSILDSLHRAGRLPFDDTPTTLKAERGYFRKPIRKYKRKFKFAIDQDNVAKTSRAGATTPPACQEHRQCWLDPRSRSRHDRSTPTGNRR